jgi:hypothetical protein
MSYYKKALDVLNWVVKQWPNNTKLILSIINSVNDNQMLCKKWLVTELKDVLDCSEVPKNPKILVMAGWYGLVGDMCRTKLKAEVVVVDKDILCQPVGNKLYPDIKHKFGEIEKWTDFDYDIIICTSCEHIEQSTLNKFIAKKKDKTIVVLQSNNYFTIEDHINCKGSLREFSNSCKLQIIKEDELITDGYTRFMIFGL